MDFHHAYNPPFQDKINLVLVSDNPADLLADAQAIRRELTAADVPPCLETMRAEMVEYMDLSLDVYGDLLLPIPVPIEDLTADVEAATVALEKEIADIQTAAQAAVDDAVAASTPEPPED